MGDWHKRGKLEPPDLREWSAAGGGTCEVGGQDDVREVRSVCLAFVNPSDDQALMHSVNGERLPAADDSVLSDGRQRDFAHLCGPESRERAREISEA